MTPADIAAINDAAMVFWRLARQREQHVDVLVNIDGRVSIVCSGDHGYVQALARGDLAEGSALPLPGEALAKLTVKP